MLADGLPVALADVRDALVERDAASVPGGQWIFFSSGTRRRRSSNLAPSPDIREYARASSAEGLAVRSTRRDELNDRADVFDIARARLTNST